MNPDLLSLLKNPKIEYIPLHHNHGIAYALNVGAKKAIEDKYAWLLTMDQDSKFRGDDVSKILDNASTLDTDDRIGIISPFHSIPYRETPKTNEITDELTVMTSGNLVNLKAYAEVSGFDDTLFIDCVDFDFCLRLKIAGYRVIRDNSSILNHNLGNRSQYRLFNPYNLIRNKPIFSIRFTGNHSAFRKFYIIRNRLILMKRYRKIFPEFARTMRALVIDEFVNTVFTEKDKIPKIRAMMRGIKEYRRYIQTESSSATKL